MSKILIKLLKDKFNINWKGAKSTPFISYSISESDFRNKTASFKTKQHIDLSAGTYQILISDPYHENFAGIILSEDYNPQNEEYTYKCQDFHRLYLNKVDGTWSKVTGRQLIERYLAFGAITHKPTKKQRRKYRRQLSGLKKNSMYQQEKYGSVIRFNPMTQVYTNQVTKNKTMMEVIEAYTLGTKSFIDLYFNDYGILQFKPYDIDDFMNPTITISDIYDNWSWKSDTTNIITTAYVEGEGLITSGSFSKYELNDIFLELNTFVTAENKTVTGTKGAPSKKTNQTKSKLANPYSSKKKEVWLVMDRWKNSKSTDLKFLNSVANGLKKKGWKTHTIGVSPGLIISNEVSKCKNGVYLIIVNGQDCEVYRHIANDPFFAQKLKNNKSIPVLAHVGISNKSSIKKGGKYHNYLGMAHDGTGKGSPGLKYPAGFLATCGVPFFYANSANECVEKFCSGGDSKKALKTNYIKRKNKGGYYTNWNWGSDY